MNETSKNTSGKVFEEILKKIKKLEVDVVYNVSKLSERNPTRRVYISRLADKGEIVKVKRGFFYKPTNKTIYKDSDLLVPLNKSIFVNNLFWSVNDGYMINAKDLIKAYITDYTEEDLMALYGLFGYKRIIKETLILYKKRTDENYKKIREILERFEKWRLDDK